MCKALLGLVVSAVLHRHRRLEGRLDHGLCHSLLSHFRLNNFDFACLSLAVALRARRVQKRASFGPLIRARGDALGRPALLQAAKYVAVALPPVTVRADAQLRAAALAVR
jgi:hypothetical protein